ncbi:Hypothetical protein A7982_10979 [Minicystis rosea]|nr:Hypothetical protein A7982_10979 [Minicystis rosea]
MRVLLLSIPWLVVACSNTPPQTPSSSGQSFPQAVTMICDVDRLAGVIAESDPLGAGAKRSAWLAAHVESPDGIELKTLMCVKGAADQAKMLRERAHEVGVSKCALADALEKTGEGGLAP